MTDLERIDEELRYHLEALHHLEDNAGWTGEQVMGAQRILTETAAYLRGHRPPRTWEEAWALIEHRRNEGRLRGPGGR